MKKRILVIHSIRDMRDMIKDVLDSYEYLEVEGVGTIAEALKSIGTAKPVYDLIIMQLSIGTDAERQVIIQCAGAAKILIITGSQVISGEFVRDHCGADGFLALPWREDDSLVEILNELLGLGVPRQRSVCANN